MRFTAFFTVMAAGSAIASYQPPAAEEDTTTLTSTTTHFITVTKCADTNPDCPHNQPSTSEPPAVPTPESVSSYEPVPEPTSEPVPEPETSSSIVIVETSSIVYEEPSSSSIYYPVPSNSTSHGVPSASESVPVVTTIETEIARPSSPVEEPSQVPGSGASGVALQGGLLAGMLAIGVAALL